MPYDEVIHVTQKKFDEMVGTEIWIFAAANYLI